MNEKSEFLRHAVATVAYRAARALDGAPADFAEFNGTGRTPGQILAHMGDLFDWALSCVEGQERWHNSKPLGWEEEKRRFFATLGAFDRALAGDLAPECELERLFQGPVADALTHVGQITMMRRLAGYQSRGENFYVAEIKVGQTGAEQPAPVQPF